MRLRLTQLAALEGDRYPVTVTWTDDDGTEETVEGLSAARLTDDDRADMRWYFEEALEQCTYDPPARNRAVRVESRMDDLGKILFRAFFEVTGDARDLWARVRDRIKDTRIEISTSVAETSSIPWELLRDPRTDRPLLQTASAFVRVPKCGAVRPNSVQLKEDEPLRVLLAICRPGGTEDVSFRSVARQLVKGLGNSKTVDLTVLRPPTYGRLEKVLAEAKAAGKPFHLLHFDGHGAYAPAPAVGPATPGMERFRALDAPRGMLYFEDPAAENHLRAVDGRTLGALLNDNGVAALVLNACQSADAGDGKGGYKAKEASTDPVEQVRAQGSLAQEAVDAGVGAVLAMRYSVYVVTAAAFVGRFYELVAAGRSFGEAASEARKALAADPMRDFGGLRVAFQDWSVPVVFEANPTPLLPARRQVETAFDLDAPATGDGLPPAPDIGFIGRDGELLRLDRAFDDQHIVLLYAYAGSGKTVTAAEFARWYRGTGGIYDEAKRTNGKIWFDRFERHLPLARLLDRVEQTFGERMQQRGVNWLALDTAGRVAVTLQILNEIPVLWIWDNVETVAGFPAGTPSSWSAAEQAELKDFLSSLRDTKAKVLLTSRRDDQRWLGDLPARIPMYPMPMAERRELAAVLAGKYENGPALMHVVASLLEWSGGNPMALTVALRQALRDKRITPGLIAEYVAKLRAGEADFADDETEGRSKALGASLAYGYETFSADERALLSLLHFFQGQVNALALEVMGREDNPNAAAPYAGLSCEEWIKLLSRAVEIGLMMHECASVGRRHQEVQEVYFIIHPALPWFLKREFERSFPDPALPTNAWVWAMASLSNFLVTWVDDGLVEAVKRLQALEANLLVARAIAVRQGWAEAAIALMQGLRKVYQSAGRWGAWAELVAGVVPLVEDDDGDPLPGREADWSLTIEYRVTLADHAWDNVAAIALLQKCVAVNSRLTAGLMAVAPVALTEEQRHQLQSLSIAWHNLGARQMQAGDPTCLGSLQSARDIDHRIGPRLAEALVACDIGRAYMDVTVIRNLGLAAAATSEGLALFDPQDATYLAKCHSQLGKIAWERFGEARALFRHSLADRGTCLHIVENNILSNLLQTAEREYLAALNLAPAEAYDARAMIHNHLGALYTTVGECDQDHKVHMYNQAVTHFQHAIQYDEWRGDPYGAAQSRLNLALLFYRGMGKLVDAKDYAVEALKGFAAFGDRVQAEITQTQALLAAITQEQDNKYPP